MVDNHRREGGDDNIMLDTLYDKKFVIARYKISMGALNQWIMKGKIPYMKIGKAVRFSEKALRKWEEGRKHKSKCNEMQPNVL